MFILTFVNVIMVLLQSKYIKIRSMSWNIQALYDTSFALSYRKIVTYISVFFRKFAISNLIRVYATMAILSLSMAHANYGWKSFQI